MAQQHVLPPSIKVELLRQYIVSSILAQGLPGVYRVRQVAARNVVHGDGFLCAAQAQSIVDRLLSRPLCASHAHFKRLSRDSARICRRTLSRQSRSAIVTPTTLFATLSSPPVSLYNKSLFSRHVTLEDKGRLRAQ